jgi:uncharacterized protein YidB (DUF937 family)
MSRGFPSMTALLGLIAIAGYQNRDRLAEMLGGNNGHNNTGAPQGSTHAGGGLTDLLGSLRGNLGGGGAGGFLANGLRELVDRFQGNGRGDVAQSWVNRGANKEIAPHDLEAAVGSDVLAELSRRTGLSQQELLNRLSRELPSAVDKYTPDGRIPDEEAVDSAR